MSSTATATVDQSRALSDGSVGWLHSWDVSVGVDGPGTRLVLFVSGCPLRCLCCDNLDTWRPGDGEKIEIDRIEDLIARYQPFIGSSGGGLTVSGAEPLQHAAFTRRALQAARRAGMHTALDTSGFCGRHADAGLLDATDLVLLDIKAGTDACHRRLTGRPLAPTLEFARRLAERAQVTWVRYVVVPGFNDDSDELDAFIDVVRGLGNVQRVEVVPFHTLSRPRYERLEVDFALERTPPAFSGVLDAVRARMTGAGLRAY